MIRQVVREEAIASQEQLVAALARVGCEVTQATVSRDLREIGLQKGRDATGCVRYLLTAHFEEKPDAPAACARMLKDFGRGMALAQNLLVLRCDPGAAPGLGRVVDELDHESILGCVAGDDTVIVVTKDIKTAEAVFEYLRELGG